MDWLQHNRQAWNADAAAGGPWSTPVDDAALARAAKGDWQVHLTPKLPVPREWFAGEIAGRDLLGLASGGGQQMPLFAAAGARVTSFDFSEGQLGLDAAVCERAGLPLRCVQGDMRNLTELADASFDLIFHPASNCFVPEVLPVWRECWRVLRPGGVLLAGFMNPAVYLFDHEVADASGQLQVCHRLPYSELEQPEAQARRQALGQPLEFSHSLDTLIGGQLQAGFLLTALFEDHWFDNSWLYSRHAPICIATRAIKPA